MKTMSKRAWVLYVLVIAFLAGLIVLFYTFYTNADSWAMKKANRHLYSSGTLSVAGTITDEKGEILAQTVNGVRTYSDNKNIRIATMHTVGDSEGFIATGVQTSYKDTITGYNFIDGIYNLKKYGKGNDVTLSINAELCAAAYKALGKNKGTVGVYNYKTGQLLCVVSNPSYDIKNKPTANINNDKTGAYEGVYLNRFFSGVYTPGSTFKIVTSICAIENIPDIYSRKFKCTGEYKVDGSSIKCLGTHGTITFEQALNRSCNSAFSQIAIELGNEKLMATAQKLGIGTKLVMGNIKFSAGKVDLTGAADIDLGWAGIGQYTIRVNPCRMLMIAGAIANGGAAANPYLIEKVASQTGRELSSAETTFTEAMMSSDTALKMKELLRSDVKNYYGDGKFPGLQMCGKTGTAEVSSEEGGKKPHAWFLGFSSREDLPFAIVVVAENGGGGSSVAIPIANKTMQKAMDIYGNK